MRAATTCLRARTHRSTRLGLPALVWLTVLLPATAWSADWVRVDTPNFMVYGNAGEKRVRDVAAEFERFREAMSRVLPKAGSQAAVPTIVVVFDSKRSYDTYRPMFNGKRVEVSGYFQPMEDENLVTLSLEDREHAFRTLFHEYAHLVVSNVAHNVPVWASEGLAEYYSTFELSADGRQGTAGQVIPSHLRLLSEERLLTLKELIGVTHDSSLYNEGNRRSVFYAQSWALVHMLISTDPSRAAAFGKYLQAASLGVPAETAWRDAFGTFDAIAELKKYITRDTVRGFLYKFDQGLERVQGTTTKITPAESEAALCDIVRRTASADEAATRLEKSLTPGAPGRVRALLGMIRLEQRQTETGRQLLLEAAADTSDWFVQYRVASGLTRVMAGAGGSPAPELVAAARRALEIVRRERPDLPHALALDAEIAGMTTTDLPKGLAAIQRARSLAPGRERYAFTEANIDVELGQFVAARAVLGPLMSAAYEPRIRDHARSVMTYVGDRERYAAERSRRTSGTDAAGKPDASAPPPSAGGSRPATFTPDYRKTSPGETRTEGMLEAIECVRDGVVLHVRAGASLLRFQAARFDAIDFITYRDDLSGGVSCGARKPPDAVYVTWRAAPAGAAPSNGEPVAVEFLPRRQTP